MINMTKMTNEFIQLRENYPPIISGVQASKILHLSSRKLAWILKAGYIRHTDTGKKTHSYQIELESLIEYIEDSLRHSKKYPIPSVFTAKKATPKTDSQSTVEAPKSLSKWLRQEWREAPELLTVKDIENLIGYRSSTIRKWIKCGKIKCVKTTGVDFIRKGWLVRFVVGKGFEVKRKSEKHREILERFNGG